MIEIIDHSGDGEINVKNARLDGLFEETMWGMLGFIIDGKAPTEDDEIQIAVSAFNAARVMTKFLSEVLYQVQEKRFYPARLDIRKVSPKKMYAVIHGIKGKAPLKSEIKNVTYNNYRLAETSEGWECNIVFDL